MTWLPYSYYGTMLGPNTKSPGSSKRRKESVSSEFCSVMGRCRSLGRTGSVRTGLKTTATPHHVFSCLFHAHSGRTRIRHYKQPVFAVTKEGMILQISPDSSSWLLIGWWMARCLVELYSLQPVSNCRSPSNAKTWTKKTASHMISAQLWELSCSHLWEIVAYRGFSGHFSPFLGLASRWPNKS